MVEAEKKAIALECVVMDRIHELWAYRSWYQTHFGWVPETQTETRAELRYLVSMVRKARKLAAPPIEHPADMTYAALTTVDPSVVWHEYLDR